MLPGIVRLLIVVFAAASVHAANVMFVVPADVQRARCEVHVHSDATEDVVAPCGESITIAAKRAEGWVESAAGITPFLTDVAGGGRFAADRFVPSGTVVSEGEAPLRIVSLVPPHGALFARDLTTSARFPAGRAIALRLDSRGRAVAASMIDVQVDRQTRIQVRGDAVVAWLTRPSGSDDDVAVRLDEREPDAFVSGTDAIVALWMNVSAQSAPLTAESKTLRLVHDRVDIATLVEEALVRKPSLELTIGDASVRNLELTVRNTDGQVIRRMQAEAGKTVRIELLPASLLSVALDIDRFVLLKNVDLTSGDDASIDIPLEPILVSGNIYLGDAPARAHVRFLQKGEAVSVDSDAAGAYEVTLWQPRRYIVETVILEHPEIPPLAQDVAIASSRTLDVHIPQNALSARVYDSESRKPVEGAHVVIHNRWSDESGASSATASVTVTGELTPLPPLRNGVAEINVTAHGYTNTEPLTITIDDALRTRVVDLPMARSAHEESFQVRIGSAPAGGAELAAFSGDQLLWRGVADDRGLIAIPNDMRERRLVVRHAAAASLAFFGVAPGTTITLEPVAPPLAVRVAPRAAGIRLTLLSPHGAVRWSGAEAMFATWTSELPVDGIFVLKGLDRQPLRILTTLRANHAPFDALATLIPFPWPAITTIPLADPQNSQ